MQAGTPFADPLHVEVLRDLVVLHYVRSHRYRGVYTNAFKTVSVNLRSKLIKQYPEQLRREALRQTGLHLTGSPGDPATASRGLRANTRGRRFGATAGTPHFGRAAEELKTSQV
ncbi:hypothetical protein [Streptomyces sp. NBC_00009]|uniref:hypothetical protein n=1 Tax=Streptomyces sp. NBC_00009 TaxID=2975620 RepID=UPI0032528F2A